MITEQLTVWCDGCVRWEQESVSKRRTIRKMVARKGWVYKNGKDYCPWCKKELAQKSNTE